MRGFEYASRKYGRKPWADVMAPAVALAEKGFPVSYELAKSLRGEAKRLERFPESKRIFLRDGKLYEAGRNIRAARTGAHAAAHPGAGRARFL